MKEVNILNQYLIAFWETVKKSKLLSILFVIAIIGSIFIVYSKWGEKWEEFLDPFAGIATLFVAIGIALENYHKTWKESLPKVLTVHYTLNGVYHLSCFYADLTSEGDIRNWAQQIGQQMTGGAFLDFHPFFDFEQPKMITLESNQEKVMYYELTILLNSNRNLKSREGASAFSEEEYKRWFVIHSKGHSSDRKIEMEITSPFKKFKAVTYQEALEEEKKINHKASNISNDKPTA